MRTALGSTQLNSASHSIQCNKIQHTAQHNINANSLKVKGNKTFISCTKCCCVVCVVVDDVKLYSALHFHSFSIPLYYNIFLWYCSGVRSLWLRSSRWSRRVVRCCNGIQTPLRLEFRGAYTLNKNNETKNHHHQKQHFSRSLFMRKFIFTRKVFAFTWHTKHQRVPMCVRKYVCMAFWEFSISFSVFVFHFWLTIRQMRAVCRFSSRSPLRLIPLPFILPFQSASFTLIIFDSVSFFTFPP